MHFENFSVIVKFNPPIRGIKCPYFFNMTSFKRIVQKSGKISFGFFFGDLKTPKGHFEIKVHILWEGPKFLRNLNLRFVQCSNGQIYNFVAFSEYINFNWPLVFTNIWSLAIKVRPWIPVQPNLTELAKTCLNMSILVECPR